MVVSKFHTIEEFEQWLAQPENAGRLFELINGEIIEVAPGRTRNSELSHVIVVAVHNFCQQRGLPCHTSGGDGAYTIQGHVVAPDFAFKRTPMSEDYPDPVAPEWAVEIIPPTDKATDIKKKRKIYRDAGILLWEMYPEFESVDVYPPGESLREYGINDTLDAGDALPGFKLPVKDIFKK